MSYRTVHLAHPIFGIDVEILPVAELKRHFAPRKLPAEWKGPYAEAEDSLKWERHSSIFAPISVLMSACREADGKLWLHVSLGRWDAAGTRKVEPHWSEITLVKDLFIGPDRKALIVLPAKAEYVNLAEVHHLWCCVEGEDPLPDFSSGLGTI